jgi:hypothetical protein
VCYRFEGNLTDESGNGNDATPSTETYVAGQAGQAMRSIANTESRIAESPDLDVSQLTIEMWIRPTQIPAAGRAGLFDNDGQYGFFLLPGGNLQCTGGGAVPTNVVGAVAADVWTHVACTYDGATRIVYVNGAAGGTTPSGSPLALTGTNGSALAGNAPTGDPLLGDVDSFRLWGVVRSPVEICQAAGCP